MSVSHAPPHNTPIPLIIPFSRTPLGGGSIDGYKQDYSLLPQKGEALQKYTTPSQRERPREGRIASLGHRTKTERSEGRPTHERTDPDQRSARDTTGAAPC